MILLTASPLTIVIGVGILFIISGAVYFSFRAMDKKKASDFINDLSDKIVEITLKTISEVAHSTEHTTLEEFEAKLLENIYNNVWDFVKARAEESESVGQITRMVFSLITKEDVIKFVQSILEQYKIEEKISDKFIELKAGYEEKLVAEDNALIEEYSNQEEYVEESNEEELPLAEEKEHTEEEIAAINPPREDDEETAYDPEDDSQEIVDETKPMIIVRADKNGNIIYYEVDPNGKKKKVSKAYAESVMSSMV